MSEKELEIGINTKANLEGAHKAKQALKDVGDEAENAGDKGKKAGEGLEEAGKKLFELLSSRYTSHEALHAITDLSKGGQEAVTGLLLGTKLLGEAVEGLTGPWGLVLGAVVTIVGLLSEQFDHTQTKLEDAAKAAEAKGEDIKNALERYQAAIDKANASLEHMVAVQKQIADENVALTLQLNQSAADRIKNAQAEEQSQIKLAEAHLGLNKTIELSEAKTAAERQAIEDRYAIEKADLEQKGKLAEISSQIAASKQEESKATQELNRQVDEENRLKKEKADFDKKRDEAYSESTKFGFGKGSTKEDYTRAQSGELGKVKDLSDEIDALKKEKTERDEDAKESRYTDNSTGLYEEGPEQRYRSQFESKRLQGEIEKKQDEQLEALKGISAINRAEAYQQQDNSGKKDLDYQSQIDKSKEGADKSAQDIENAKSKQTQLDAGLAAAKLEAQTEKATEASTELDQRVKAAEEFAATQGKTGKQDFDNVLYGKNDAEKDKAIQAYLEGKQGTKFDTEQQRAYDAAKLPYAGQLRAEEVLPHDQRDGFDYTNQAKEDQLQGPGDVFDPKSKTWIHRGTDSQGETDDQVQSDLTNFGVQQSSITRNRAFNPQDSKIYDSEQSKLSEAEQKLIASLSPSQKNNEQILKLVETVVQTMNKNDAAIQARIDSLHNQLHDATKNLYNTNS